MPGLIVGVPAARLVGARDLVAVGRAEIRVVVAERDDVLALVLGRDDALVAPGTFSVIAVRCQGRPVSWFSSIPAARRQGGGQPDGERDEDQLRMWWLLVLGVRAVIESGPRPTVVRVGQDPARRRITDAHPGRIVRAGDGEPIRLSEAMPPGGVELRRGP